MGAPHPQLRMDVIALGALAQLGERLHGMQEVSGSIPLGSTIFPQPVNGWGGIP